MSTIKEYIWNGSGYVELDAGTVDGRDSLEFETADPEIQNHIKTPHASVATVNSNRADIDVIKNSGYLKGVDGIEFEDFNPVNAQFLDGNPASYFAKQSDLNINTSAIGQKANKAQESWIKPTLQNGWLFIGDARDLAYYKSEIGEVRLTGEVLSGIATSGTIITTLPVSYRPKTTISTVCVRANDGSYFYIHINAFGEVVLSNLNSTGTLRINVSFRAV